MGDLCDFQLPRLTTGNGSLQIHSANQTWFAAKSRKNSSMTFPFVDAEIFEISQP